MKTKKILIFSTAYYPLVGGAEVAIKEITDRIPDIEFDLITARLNSKVSKMPFDMPERVGNVNVYRLGFGVPILDKLLLPFWGALKAIKLNNKNNYNFYWCMMVTYASGAGFIANILRFWKPVPIILTLQEGDSEEHFKNSRFGLINLSWWLALKNTSILTVLSSYLAERAKRFGYLSEIKIIPNGVDMSKFEKEINQEEKNKIREELGVKEGDTALITTSRLVLKNGVGDVIKALPKLNQNIIFVIFGEGELKQELQELAKNLNVSEKVVFKGFVSHEDMPKYLEACDIFIRASLSEGFGNSFIEAMACKIPVIATSVGGIVDFLIDEKTGYFCEPQNPQSIAKTIQKVITDPNKNQIINNAFNMVKEKYDWDLVAQQMRVVFNNII
ncbi:MAG: glycosyltransferase family 4 protein [Patescibacteria group bacterium]